MSTDGSAYSTLGLAPGADAAAIERAYKRLIKQFHPDRAGGDARRAAEITRAYRELRAAAGYKDSLEFNDLALDQDRGVRTAVVMLAAAGVLALLLVAGPIAGVGKALLASPSPPSAAPIERPAEAIGQPLAAEAIREGIREAVRLTRSSDEVALAAASR